MELAHPRVDVLVQHGYAGIDGVEPGLLKHGPATDSARFLETPRRARSGRARRATELERWRTRLQKLKDVQSPLRRTLPQYNSDSHNITIHHVATFTLK